MKVPRTIDELAQSCSTMCEPVYLVDNREMLVKMCGVINNFCESRVIPRNVLAVSATSFSSSEGRVNNALELKPISACDIQDLRALKTRIPLDHYAFKIASKITYERLGGCREIFEGGGGGKCKASIKEGTEPTIQKYFFSFSSFCLLLLLFNLEF